MSVLYSEINVISLQPQFEPSSVSGEDIIQNVHRVEEDQRGGKMWSMCNCYLSMQIFHLWCKCGLVLMFELWFLCFLRFEWLFRVKKEWPTVTEGCMWVSEAHGSWEGYSKWYMVHIALFRYKPLSSSLYSVTGYAVFFLHHTHYHTVGRMGGKVAFTILPKETLICGLVKLGIEPLADSQLTDGLSPELQPPQTAIMLNKSPLVAPVFNSVRALITVVISLYTEFLYICCLCKICACSSPGSTYKWNGTQYYVVTFCYRPLLEQVEPVNPFLLAVGDRSKRSGKIWQEHSCSSFEVCLCLKDKTSLSLFLLDQNLQPRRHHVARIKYFYSWPVKYVTFIKHDVYDANT